MSIIDTLGNTAGLAVGAISNLIFSEETHGEKLQKNNPHGSFAETRENVHAKWFVDGKDYFYAVSEALSSAKKEIFIEDWWLSPELYLRRPPAKNEHFRLDRLLKKKAEEGVKVYVVVYKEVSQLLTLNSEHSKIALQSLHPNIKVQRHPDHDVDGTYLWAHHEKMVVIDRRIAFIGGLDLCFGRYDTHSHQLADNARISNHVEVWPGQDYSNPRILDFAEVNKWTKPLIDRKEFARMPWHDVSIGFVGKPALDVARHFIERWNFIKKEKAENRPEYPVLIAKSDAQYAREHKKEYPTGFETYEYFGNKHSVHPEQGTVKVQILRSSSKWSHGIETEHSIMNAYIRLIREAKHFIYIENQFFCTATKASNSFAVKNLLGQELVERIKIAHQKKEKFRVIVCMPLLPSFPAEVDSNDAATLRLVCHYQYLSICRGGESIFDELKEAGINPEDYIQFFALRSYDKINRQA
ncbi:2049_t:CDS:2, partial [Paraglomus brasilianum]